MVSSAPSRPITSQSDSFDWPLCHEAERLLTGYIEAFLLRQRFARQLADRMRDETGTDFFEWVDHLVLAPEHAGALRTVGFIEERVEAPTGTTVFWHPRAMMPLVLLRADGGRAAVPSILAIRPEAVVDFVAAHDLISTVEGAFGARLRRVVVSEENGSRLEAIERLGCRGYVTREPTADFVRGVVRTRELWRTRKRDFPDDADGVKQAMARLDDVLELVDCDVACDL